MNFFRNTLIPEHSNLCRHRWQNPKFSISLKCLKTVSWREYLILRGIRQHEGEGNVHNKKRHNLHWSPHIIRIWWDAKFNCWENETVVSHGVEWGQYVLVLVKHNSEYYITALGLVTYTIALGLVRHTQWDYTIELVLVKNFRRLYYWVCPWEAYFRL